MENVLSLQWLAALAVGKHGIRTPSEHLEEMVLDAVVATMRMPFFVAGDMVVMLAKNTQIEVILCINMLSPDYFLRTRVLMRHAMNKYDAIVEHLVGPDRHASVMMTGENIKNMLEDGFIDMLARKDAIIIVGDYMGENVEIYPLPPTALFQTRRIVLY